MPVLKFSRVVELSHPIHPEIPQWQGDPPVIFTPHTDIPSSGYFLRAFSMGEHSGTHLNAPASFITGGRGVDEIPAGQLLLPAVVISITEKARQTRIMHSPLRILHGGNNTTEKFPQAHWCCCIPAGHNSGTTHNATMVWMSNTTRISRDLTHNAPVSS